LVTLLVALPLVVLVMVLMVPAYVKVPAASCLC
jgi:hypothetical protein